MIYVGAEGPSNAKLAAVGEAPGADEERLGRPFAGASGQMVDDLLSQHGLPRNQVYVTNVCKIRPPGNDIKELHLLGKSINDFIPQLQEEIRQLNPNAILAFGNTALQALTGYHGIEKYRGSIMPCNFHSCKVIPTIHPASILHAESDGRMRSWKDLIYIGWDVARAIKESMKEEYEPVSRNLLVCRSALNLDRFIRLYRGPYVSVDIETFKTIPICIGLAFDSHNAISIPFFNFAQDKLNPDGMTRSDVISCWQMVAEILYDLEIAKIGQNFKFDQRLLMNCRNDEVPFGLKVNSFFFDTMLAFRTLYPELPATLQFQTSVLTEEIYYKDEGKEYNPKKDKFERLLLYNAKDAAVTFEVFEKEFGELENRGLTEFFFNRVMPLHHFYSRVEQRGIKRDNSQKLFLERKYRAREKELQDELNNLTSYYTDEPIKVNSNGARGDVPKLLFGLMKVPVRKDTSEQSLDALMRNAVKDPEKKRIIQLILEIRKVKKTIGTYIDHEVDYRGRTLTGVRIALETGRTSTGILKPPVSTESMGLAFQTITKHGDVGSDIRSMFVPDDGYILMEPDLQAAEARVVAILAKDEKLLKIFKYDLDIHRITAAWMDYLSIAELDEFFDCEDESRILVLRESISKKLKIAIDDESRQIGKKFRHAGHYAMGKKEASRQVGFSEWRCGQILEKFHGTNPKIRNVFHHDIREALQNNNRILTSPHGRQRQFFNKWGDELFKEAYAQIPQSTVSDHLKFQAQVIEHRAPWIQMLSESHDSFLAQVPKSHVNEAVKIIKEELEVPINFEKCSLSRGELTIPCEIKIGEKSWENMERIA